MSSRTPGTLKTLMSASIAVQYSLNSPRKHGTLGLETGRIVCDRPSDGPKVQGALKETAGKHKLKTEVSAPGAPGLHSSDGEK